MKYNRNRTETLTLRLTPEEKNLIKHRAGARNMTLTEYILRSSIGYSEVSNFAFLLKQIDELRSLLKGLQQRGKDVNLPDAVTAIEKIYNDVLSAVTESKQNGKPP